MGNVRLTSRKPGRATPKTFSFDVNGADASFEIAAERIAGWNLVPVDDRSLDLLDVAGAVFAADGLVPRGGLIRPEFGDAWRRDLTLDIALRDPAFWNRSEVNRALTSAIEFLTDDQISFTFRKQTAAPPKQDYLDFETSTDRPTEGAHVVLFSGGLDSLAGALETLARERGKVILVTHRSAPKITARQNDLVQELRRRNRGRVHHVPITATFRNQVSKERTQRSRSFLFAAFGYVIARIVGADRLNFFENGIVSHNLLLSPQIIGTMATRTTHPFALRNFEKLLGLIEDRPFVVRNGFEWLTKTEVVGKLRDHGASDLIAQAVSCNHVYDRTRKQTHCGACSQCLDRRFGILAAGLQDHEPDTIYETSILTGARDGSRSKVMALEWTRHAIRLATIDAAGLQERFGGEIARIARGYPEMPGREVLRRVLDLHIRHGRSIWQALDAATKAHSGDLVLGSLPKTSLLRAFLAETDQSPVMPNVDVAKPDVAALAPPIDWPENDRAVDDGLVVAMSCTGRRRRLEVKGLGIVEGAPAGPAFALRPQFERDRVDGLAPEDHRHVRAGHMAPEGGPSKSSVTQNVRRCRTELAELYRAVRGAPPEADLLIQNRRNLGYRLDPKTQLIDPSPGVGTAGD